MWRFSSQKLYGLIVVLAILVGGYFALRDERQKVAVANDSPTWEPWLAYGVICNSQVTDDALPRVGWGTLSLTVGIYHPPGTREVVTQAIRDLVRTGRPPQPWPETLLDSYEIQATECFHSWQEFYQTLGPEGRARIDALVEQNGDKVTEEELRKAILRDLYEAKGTLNAALKMYPVEPVTRKRQ
jgi:hypothetical protein